MVLVLCVVSQVSANWESVSFSNCAGPNGTFRPMDAIAFYNETSRILTLSIRGNQSTALIDVDPQRNVQSSLFSSVTTVSNELFSSATAFCPNVTKPFANSSDASCPWGPGIVAFTAQVGPIGMQQLSSYTTLLRVLEPSAAALEVVCVEVETTPTFASSTDILLSVLPFGVLVMVALVDFIAQVYNPWTSSYNVFRASANFAMDPDVLRLVTPGLLDAWMYIQFAILTASLNLNYAGFFQPVLSRVAWANLLFNTTISNQTPLGWTVGVRDFTNQSIQSTNVLINSVRPEMDGIERYARLVGLSRTTIWQTCILWFLIVFVGVVVLFELVLGLTWIWGQITGYDKIDLIGHNLPFVGGNNTF